MDCGVTIPTQGPYARPEVFATLVAKAEELGYGHAWFGDHIVIPDYAAEVSHGEWFESVACSAVGAGRTTRLRFGFDVLVLPYRSPLVLAKQLATVDALSGGRVTLAVGVGFLRGEFEALGVPPFEARAAVLEEHVAVLRDLWGGPGARRFDGRWTSYRDVHSDPPPVQDPSIPIWLGGNSPAAIRRAAAIGDGWHPLWPSLDQYRRAADQIRSRRAELGRSGRFTFSYSCPETRLLDPGHQAAGREPYGGVELPDEFGYAPPVPRRDGRQILQGTADELRSDVALLADAGIEQLTLRFWAGSPDVTPAVFVEQMERFAAEVLAHVA